MVMRLTSLLIILLAVSPVWGQDTTKAECGSCYNIGNTTFHKDTYDDIFYGDGVWGCIYRDCEKLPLNCHWECIGGNLYQICEEETYSKGIKVKVTHILEEWPDDDSLRILQERLHWDYPDAGRLLDEYVAKLWEKQLRSIDTTEREERQDGDRITPMSSFPPQRFYKITHDSVKSWVMAGMEEFYDKPVMVGNETLDEMQDRISSEMWPPIEPPDTIREEFKLILMSVIDQTLKGYKIIRSDTITYNTLDTIRVCDTIPLLSIWLENDMFPIEDAQLELDSCGKWTGRIKPIPRDSIICHDSLVRVK